MSWDIYLVRTKTNREPYNQIADEDIIPFSKAEIVNEILALTKTSGLCAEDLDTKFPHLRGGKWSIEFCFWDEKEPFETVHMQIRGTEEPTQVIERLKQDLNARIFDMHGGKFLESGSESGFHNWKNFSDKIIESLNGMKDKE